MTCFKSGLNRTSESGDTPTGANNKKWQVASIKEHFKNRAQ